MAGLLAALAPFGAAAALPTVELHRAETRVAPGESHVVTVRVTWNGGANEFKVQPVDVNPVDWGAVKVVSATGRSENGQHTVEQIVEIVANEPGDYQVPEFRIGLSDPEATVPSELPDSETTLPDPGAYPCSRRTRSPYGSGQTGLVSGTSVASGPSSFLLRSWAVWRCFGAARPAWATQRLLPLPS